MRFPKNALVALTVAACLPYLALKLLWLSGGTLGIPRDSPLHTAGSTLWVLNALTVLMDTVVVLLALALARPWGRRLPAPLLALPLWGASGLLGPIALGFPVQALYHALSGAAPQRGSGNGSGALLEDWVWSLVYSGFTVQGLALGTLFALYVRERWGPLLGSRPARPVPLGPAWRAAGAAGCAGALGIGVVRAVEALGLWSADPADHGADSRIVDGCFALFALLAVAGTVRLLRGAGRTRLWVPLAAVWSGSGTLACWGGWLLLGAFSGGGQVLGQRTDGLLNLLHATQAAAGLLLAAVAAHAVRHRSATLAAAPAGAPPAAERQTRSR